MLVTVLKMEVVLVVVGSTLASALDVVERVALATAVELETEDRPSTVETTCVVDSATEDDVVLVPGLIRPSTVVAVSSSGSSVIVVVVVVNKNDTLGNTVALRMEGAVTLHGSWAVRIEVPKV